MSSYPPPVAYPHPGPPPERPELPEGAEPAAPPGPRWPAWSAPVALVAGFGAAIVGYIVVAIVGAAAGADAADPPPAVQITATVLQDGALIGSALLFARLLGGRPRAWQFGLRPTRFWPATGWMALTYVAFIAFSAAWVSALGITQRDDLPEQLGVDESTAALIAVMILVTVIAPIAEEFFFRGFFFTALRSWKGPWLAAILTGIVFGGIHAGSAPVGFLVPLAAFGFGLCLLYWKTGSLYPCIALHCVNNSIAFGATQGWGWQIAVLVVVANVAALGLVLPFARRSPAVGAVVRPR